MKRLVKVLPALLLIITVVGISLVVLVAILSPHALSHVVGMTSLILVAGGLVWRIVVHFAERLEVTARYPFLDLASGKPTEWIGIDVLNRGSASSTLEDFSVQHKGDKMSVDIPSAAVLGVFGKRTLIAYGVREHYIIAPKTIEACLKDKPPPMQVRIIVRTSMEEKYPSNFIEIPRV